jgi:hypothetical protein
VLGGSQKFFWDTLQLFSSFLRGASCPKSPRVAATAASLFILDTPSFVKRYQQARAVSSSGISWAGEGAAILPANDRLGIGYSAERGGFPKV